MSLYTDIALSRPSFSIPTSFYSDRIVPREPFSGYGGTRATKARSTANERARETVRATATVVPSPTADAYSNVTTATPMTDEQAIYDATENEHHNSVARFANERMVLLARKYAKGPNQEETALRLEVLSARILNLVPRVTPQHVAALAAATRGVEDSAAGRILRAQRRAELRQQRNAGA